MASWLDSLGAPTKQSFAASWGQLLTLAETCQREHALNGKLIAMQLVQTQQALTALTAASGQTLTYGPDGQQSQHRLGSGRNLGSA
jgi:flagellar biosynthesis/type III secretory pathway chaperone